MFDTLINEIVSDQKMLIMNMQIILSES